MTSKRPARPEYMRRWRTENHEKCLGYQRKYRERNREKLRETGRKYVGTHREKVSAIARKCRYGVSEQDYGAMMAAQDGRCSICGNGNGKANLCVDHDHASGAIRGLLCVTCNAGLGSFRDNPILLQNAIGYLKGEKK